MPSVPARARVWQAPQLVWNRSFACSSLAATFSGEALSPPSLLIAQYGSRRPKNTTTIPKMKKVRLLKARGILSRAEGGGPGCRGPRPAGGYAPAGRAGRLILCREALLLQLQPAHHSTVV